MSNRIFGFIWCGILMIVAFLPLRHAEDPRWIFAVASVVLACVSVIIPKALSPLNRGWTKFGAFMHIVISETALFIIYYAFITPGGLLLRVFGWHPVSKTFDRRKESYWKPHGNEITDFTRPY
ncbi:hypothetical protein [Thalassospira povalilytica]|uniref:SxtJ n=1 Tax=Thalassospira povalilytica TaxID=732237 RepID=A0ABX4RCY6_9PROT|nr:hypothetical protein [Thalassospira povalilytica]MCC4239403.1 hypothetical protein [Thalassospira povalilytica]PKR52250.1 hypothetical protein CU041_01140 [Thalassospira povalilytica]